jgi:tRNA A-37 threonylcarbamoyl transferase component Bud32
MGWQAPIEFRDPGTELWVGEHRPELIDLEAIFRSLVSLDVSALDVGTSSATEAWRHALPNDAHVVRVLSPRTVHIHVPRGPLVKDLVLKVMPPRPDSGWRRLTERVERSRAHRAHLWAHRLRAIGIDTPRPLGFVERATKPTRYVSFSATEHVLLPALVEVRDSRLSMAMAGPGDGAAIAEKRALIDRIASMLRKMHAHGLFHADLHAGNLLVAPDSVWVIDLESMRSFAFAEHATVRALVRLNRAFLDTRMITRTDRMRFLRSYLQHQADRTSRTRELWNKVLTATQAKLRELGEAFR